MSTPIEELAQQVFQLGGRHAFGVPGSGPSLEWITAFERAGGEFLATGHEATGALMAGAIGRLTGQPAVCLAIKGPGFINLTPGLLSNSYEGYPCLAITEAYAGRDPSGRRHKWLDHAKMAGEFLRASGHLGNGAAAAQRLWQTATAEFPGPVHLELVQPAETRAIRPAIAPPAERLALSEIIRNSQRPALVVGSAGLRAVWRERLKQLCIPVFTTAAGKGLLDESLPHAAGICTGDGKDCTPERQVMPYADAVVWIAVRAGEMLNPRPSHARTLPVETASLLLGSLFPDDPLAEQAQRLDDTGMAELLDLCAEKSWGLEEVAKAKRALREQVAAWPESPMHLMDAVRAAMPEAAHVTDTGNFTVWAEHFLPAATFSDYTGTPNGRFMGTGIGYALGTSLALAPRPVVLWIGDGGLRAAFTELSLAAERQLPLLVMVIRDGYYGSVRGRARKLGWSEKPLRLSGPSVRKVADAFGFYTADAQTPAAAAEQVRQWCRQNGPGLIEYAVPPDQYADLTERLR